MAFAFATVILSFTTPTASMTLTSPCTQVVTVLTSRGLDDSSPKISGIPEIIFPLVPVSIPEQYGLRIKLSIICSFVLLKTQTPATYAAVFFCRNPTESFSYMKVVVSFYALIYSDRRVDLGLT